MSHLPLSRKYIFEISAVLTCLAFRRDYTFGQWKQPGNPGQCYSDVASGDVLTVYTRDTRQSWAAVTRQMNSSTTVVGAHINGWVFAEQTPPPAVPTATETIRPSCSSGGSTNSAIVFGIGVALAVVGIVVLAAGLLVMRRSRKALLQVAQAAVHLPNGRLTVLQGPSQGQPLQETGPGGFFLPVPARARHSSPPQAHDKQAYELDGSPPGS